MNILITGITGFFGRNFTNYLIGKIPDCVIVGTAHSENKLAYFKKSFPNIKTYIMDIASDKFEADIEAIIKNHNINYIIHGAAMKHVDICQENPIMALRVNTIASDTLIKVAQRNKVTNLIALSTDKTNNPCNTYGITKYIMQENVLSNNYSVYQGANFFWSDGSVLDIWFNQYIKNKPLTIRNPNHVRYFNTINHVCERIFENLDNKSTIILPDHVYVVKLQDLLDVFSDFFVYNNIKSIEEHDYEKEIEILRDEITNKINVSKDEIQKLIKDFYNNML